VVVVGASQDRVAVPSPAGTLWGVTPAASAANADPSCE